MSEATVTVYCRTPNGLFLDLLDTTGEQPVVKKRVAVRGWHQMTIAGLQHGETVVTKAFWDAWALANKASDLIKNKIIFADEKTVNAKALLAEIKDEKTGLEALTQTDMPKGVESVATVYGE